MPTGYTHSIKDGISFENFALKCARNFGACIALRDEGGDVLPTIDNIQFKDDNYHQEELENVKNDLRVFQNRSEQEWSDAFEKHVQEHTTLYKNYIKENKKLLLQYKEMLTKVEDWIPPTCDHTGLKNFMKQQIVESIKYDCNTEYYEDELRNINNLTLQEYREEETEKAQQSIEYHSKHVHDDSVRNAKRIEWLQKLLDSLKK